MYVHSVPCQSQEKVEKRPRHSNTYADMCSNVNSQTQLLCITSHCRDELCDATQAITSRCEVVNQPLGCLAIHQLLHCAGDKRNLV